MPCASGSQGSAVESKHMSRTIIVVPCHNEVKRILFDQFADFVDRCPDVDLLFKFVDGANHHSNETHSLGFALLAAVAAALAFRLSGWRRPLILALAVGLAWSSHVLLDVLNLDTHPPIGVLALLRPRYSSAFVRRRERTSGPTPADSR